MIGKEMYIFFNLESNSNRRSISLRDDDAMTDDEQYGRVLFDHRKSTVLVAADGEGSGYWVGACSVAKANDSLYVYYRRRGPRPDRGNRCYIIKSGQKLSFDSFFLLMWCTCSCLFVSITM